MTIANVVATGETIYKNPTGICMVEGDGTSTLHGVET